MAACVRLAMVLLLVLAMLILYGDLHGIAQIRLGTTLPKLGAFEPAFKGYNLRIL